MKNKLGQNFLKSKGKIKQIIDALELQNSDIVIEIGPGKGALTKELGERGKSLEIKAIERDEKLIDYLKKKVVPEIEKSGNKIEIIYGNALKKLPEIANDLNSVEYKIVGNIPYYITGQLFRVLGDIKNKPERIVLTVQKEVADRIVSKPPNMNILSASVAFWADIEKITNISKKHFKPEPKVDSAVIKLTPKNNIDWSKSENYYKAMNILFHHSRKTTLNNISIGTERDKKEIKRLLKEKGIDPQSRPQNIGVEKIKKISSLLYNK